MRLDLESLKSVKPDINPSKPWLNEMQKADSVETAFCICGWRLKEKRSEDERDRCQQLDQHVQRGAGGVFEGIAHGVADYSCFVGVGFFAAVLAGFDPLLSVIPGSATVVHQHSEQDS